MPTKVKKSTSTKTKMSTVVAPTGFIKVTRVYLKGTAKVGTPAAKTAKVGKQTTLVQVDKIEAIRLRKRVKGSNATIITTAGRYINVAEDVKALSKLVNAVYE